MGWTASSTSVLNVNFRVLRGWTSPHSPQFTTSPSYLMVLYKKENHDGDENENEVQKKDLMSKAIAKHERFKTLHISKPSHTEQKHEITN